MVKKNDGHDSPTPNAEQLQPLIDDDAFLTELSLGNDPSDGADELAALFLELREDVERPMPAAPVVEGAELEPEIISLSSARKRRRKGRPLMNGLIGAAAATVLIAGSGAAIYNAGPGSLLYGMNQSLFSSSDDAFVELASTLDEMDAAAASGDLAGTRALLEEARNLASRAQGDRQAAESEANKASRANRDSAARTTTVTETVEGPAPSPETKTLEPSESPERETVTTTVVEQYTDTVVETTTVYDSSVPNPLPPPTRPTEPTEDPGNSNGDGLTPPQVNY
jgi:hypothetical protein